MEFKDKLKEFRIQKKLTQDALASILHVSRSAVAKWENGLGIPNEESIESLCEFFQVEREELIQDSKLEEALVNKNIGFKSIIHKHRIMMLLVSSICIILLVSLIILLCNRAIYITSFDMDEIDLRECSNQSLVGKSEDDLIMNHEYGYVYATIKINRIAFTSASDLYAISVIADFVPGSAGFSNSSFKYNQNAYLTSTAVSIGIGNDTTLDYQFSAPKEIDVIEYKTSKFSTEYCIEDGTAFEGITLYKTRENRIKMESQKSISNVTESRYISSRSFNVSENQSTWTDYNVKEYGFITNRMSVCYYVEKHKVKSVGDDLVFNVSYVMQVGNRTFISEKNYHCNYAEV